MGHGVVVCVGLDHLAPHHGETPMAAWIPLILVALVLVWLANIYDLERQMMRATKVSTPRLGESIIAHMGS